MDEIVHWRQDLSDALACRRAAWMIGPLTPRIIVLPASGKHYGAWTLFGHIFITRRQLDCPPVVRKYIIGHELGHLLGGHVYLQAMFFLSYLTLIMALGSNSAITLFALVMSALLYIPMASARMSLQRELYADAVAVALYGAYNTLTSSLWMAQRVKDINTSERQARLTKLRAAVRADLMATGPPPQPTT